MPTLLLILDACRNDYADRDCAPFLSSLRTAADVRGTIESPPGFAQRTTMFTGTFPDVSGNFSQFGFDPENSPFRWVRTLGPFAAMHQARRPLYPMRKAIQAATHLMTGAYHTDPAWIPAKFLPYFGVVEDTRPIFEPGGLPLPGIFDLSRENGKQFLYAAHPISGDDEATEALVVRAAKERRPIDLFVAQFSALDEGAHDAGPLLPEGRFDGQTDRDIDAIRKALAGVDRRTERLVTALQDAYGDVNLIILGDHGMAPVRRRVNMLKTLRSTGLKAGRDYVVFLDSTFAKIWFQSEAAEERIVALLADADYGHTLTDAEKAALHIAFEGRRYGDLMFAANPGVLFWPDYFHVVEHRIQGMHGYLDKREESYGYLSIRLADRDGAVRGRRDAGLRSLVDVFPTLCDLVGVPTPPTTQGRSLIHDTPPRPRPIEAEAGESGLVPWHAETGRYAGAAPA
ncbi:MAG: alkaline phosphatase family protein [Thermoplasmatota archaeon]